MHPDLVTIVGRIASLRDRAASAAQAPALLPEIENVLAEGYAQALEGDAWSMRQQHLQDLMSNEVPVRGRELRLLATNHRRFQRDLIALRRELAALRQDRDRLAAGSRTASV